MVRTSGRCADRMQASVGSSDMPSSSSVPPTYAPLSAGVGGLWSRPARADQVEINASLIALEMRWPPPLQSTPTMLSRGVASARSSSQDGCGSARYVRLLGSRRVVLTRCHPELAERPHQSKLQSCLQSFSLHAGRL